MSQAFRKPSVSQFAIRGGQHKGVRHIMKADGTTAKSIVTDPFTMTDLPTGNPGPVSTPTPDTTVVTDSKLEVDFSKLSCDQIKSLIDFVTNLMAASRFTLPQASYYNGKLNLLYAALKTCGSPATTTAGTTLPTILLPVLPLSNPLLSTPAATDPGSAAGGGGAGAGTPTPAAKKPFPWWIVVTAGLLLFAGYEVKYAKAA